MLICCRCKLPKPVAEFAKSQRARGNRKHLCAPCRKTYHRNWYLENRERQLQRMSETRPAYKARIAAQVNRLKDRPCADCGLRYPPFVMDFDHVSGDKRFNVGDIRGGGAMDRILAEIAKCDVVCANCHRLRTHSRRRSMERPPDDESGRVLVQI